MADESQAADAVDVAARYKPVPLADFVTRDIPRRKWAVEGWWPEKRSGYIPGQPKTKKSTLSVELAISLSTGRPFLGHFPVNMIHEPGKPSRLARVTYIGAENSDMRTRRDVDLILCARGLGNMEDVEEPDVDDDGEITVEIVGQCFVPDWSPRNEDGDFLWTPDLEILTNPGMDLMLGEDQEWLLEHAAERDYIFLDPGYLLSSADPNSTKEQIEQLRVLSTVRDETDCGLILTHQMTDKHGTGDPAARMLGSTFQHGWYEAAIFCSEDSQGMSHFHADNLREMSEKRDYALRGLGVGNWFYAGDEAQGHTDSLGRRNTRGDSKATRQARLRELVADHGTDWPYERYAEALNADGFECSKTTVHRDMKDLAAAAEQQTEQPERLGLVQL